VEMKITIVYDNCLSKRGLKTGWGFSALIETNHTPPLLFDPGTDGVALLYNMEQLGIAPEHIGTIFISHAHMRLHGSRVELETLLCEEKVIPGRVVEVDFTTSRILLDEHREAEKFS